MHNTRHLQIWVLHTTTYIKWSKKIQNLHYCKLNYTIWEKLHYKMNKKPWGVTFQILYQFYARFQFVPKWIQLDIGKFWKNYAQKRNKTQREGSFFEKYSGIWPKMVQFFVSQFHCFHCFHCNDVEFFIASLQWIKVQWKSPVHYDQKVKEKVQKVFFRRDVDSNLGQLKFPRKEP